MLSEDIFVPSEPAAIMKVCAETLEVAFPVNASAILPCFAEGNPPVTWEWTRDGVQLLNEGRFTLENNGERLIISDVQQADSGPYNCTVRNENGADSYIVELIVQSKQVY